MNRIIYKNLSAGAGLGAEFLGETYMPLTLNLMYRLRHSRYSPFAMVQGGYQVPWKAPVPSTREWSPKTSTPASYGPAQHLPTILK